jgi:hypothetical protein
MSTINETFDKLRVQILEGSTSVLELANEYGPQGKLGVIESNYNAHKAYVEDLNKALEKGNINVITMVGLLEQIKFDMLKSQNLNNNEKKESNYDA